MTVPDAKTSIEGSLDTLAGAFEWTVVGDENQGIVEGVNDLARGMHEIAGQLRYIGDALHSANDVRRD